MGNSDLSVKEPIPKLPQDLEAILKKRVGLGTSFDIGLRRLKILKKDIHLYYVNGLTDPLLMTEIIQELVSINDDERQSSKIYEIIQNRLIHQSVNPVQTIDELVDQVLSGLVAVVIEGEEKALVVDVRSYPGREPEEPDTEKVVRGSRDGYVENIIVNTALTRRRIRDERLRFETLKVGERSKTDVVIGYIDDIVNEDLVKTIKKELEAVQIDGITMAEKTIEEFLLKQGYNPYPLVRYTERADVAANHLLEGHVLIFVDTSPSVIITPITFFHHLQHAEEYREAPSVGTLIRWIRFLGVAVSLFLLPLWYLFALDPSLLPEKMDFIGPNKQAEVPLIIQLFLADIGIDFLRIAAIHTPTPLSTAMGLIAAVLIGEIAVKVGLFVPEVILFVAIAAIGNFSTPSYELSVANKIVRTLLLFSVAFFKLPGFVIGSTVYILYLVKTRVLNVPYLWPFIPFNPQAFMQIFLRHAVPSIQRRPSIVQPRNLYRQPKKS